MDWCEQCPVRLFNTKCHNLEGVGNPWTNKVIIVPNVDYDAYRGKDMGFSSQVDVIKSVISSTGELDDLFILPLIRCNTNISCELNDDILRRCLHYLAKDVEKYDWKHIMLCGDAARMFLSCEPTPYLNKYIISKKDRVYSVNYSPLTKYKDDAKFEVFKTHLVNWYNSINSNLYPNYEIVVI